MDQPAFHEARPLDLPIRKLGLRIEGTPLAPIIADFEAELAAAGVVRVKPRFYLSTEWGVPFETVAIAIPFYLARPDLASMHAERAGMVEGEHRDDVLRYLRHEMGHAVNYAYRLYDRPDWVEAFGSMTQPYVEEYRPEPWSTRFVRHLPGWYAQKHPDEDWAESFAVWMTPGRSKEAIGRDDQPNVVGPPRIDWRAAYAGWPVALAKLELCDRILTEVRDQEPLVTDDELDEDVDEIDYTIEEFYQGSAVEAPALPPGLDGALRAIFDELQGGEPRRASDVIMQHTQLVARSVFTWTGHFPEHTHVLLRHLAARADALDLTCPAGTESRVLVELSVFAASLAMNHVHRGTYLP